MAVLMNLPVSRIYTSSFQALRKSPLIYLLMLIWGLAQGVILAAIFMLGGVAWLSMVIAAATLKSGGGAAIVFLTVIGLVVMFLILAFLSAATRAGLLGFCAKIREGAHATTLDFLNGILRFTFPLFIGGIVVSMLTAIPFLTYCLVLKLTLNDVVPDVFTSGWNFTQALSLVGYLWNMMLVAGAFQALVFFWITPWDEMVVLYKVPVSEALARSFSFVFSSRNLGRVVSLVLINAFIAVAVVIMVNVRTFSESIPNGFVRAMVATYVASSSSSFTSFLQFLLMPFFAFSQLYLLPLLEPEKPVDIHSQYLDPSRHDSIPPGIDLHN
jgi:hypothetical protein